MQYKDPYLVQENLEDVLSYIEGSLKRGSSVFAIARGMVGTNKAKLIVTKEYEMYMDEFQSDREVLKLLIKYINDSFKHYIERSCVTNTIKKIMEKHFYGVDIDEYSDFLTEKLNEEPYKRVHHHITSIAVSYEPYMKEYHPEEFSQMSMSECEVGLIKFIKEHLISCADKK